MTQELEIIKSLEERIEKLEQAFEAQYTINKTYNQALEYICNLTYEKQNSDTYNVENIMFSSGITIK